MPRQFLMYCVTGRRGFGLNYAGIEIREPATGVDAVVAETYHKLRKHKGVSEEAAREKAQLPHFFGALMVQAGAPRRRGW